jgi:uncharacterized membrane-anchored protein
MKISHYWKAVVATVVAGSAALAPALDDDTITSAEAATIIIAIVTAAFATWAVPNTPIPGKDSNA